MIKRLDEWFEKHSRASNYLFLGPLVAGALIIGKTYWLAGLFLLIFAIEVYSLWHYVTTVPEPEDESAKLTKVCVEKDALGNEHYLIRHYDESGEIIDSTDEMEGTRDE